jgi:hypothetical protein
MNNRKRVRLNPRVILALLTICVLSLAPVANAGVVVIMKMASTFPINPGDTVKAGYRFDLPGYKGGATTVTVIGTVVVNVSCPNGSTQTITIPLPSQTYPIPAKSSGDWFPSVDQNSPLTYQGSVTAGTCAGGEASGGTFTATFSSPASCIVIHTQFHYSDNSSGPWGPEGTVNGNNQSCLSAPCSCNN